MVSFEQLTIIHASNDMNTCGVGISELLLIILNLLALLVKK